eukprot:scaffold12646_cov60-Phaeocystis_antarctica.AAC.4
MNVKQDRAAAPPANLLIQRGVLFAELFSITRCSNPLAHRHRDVFNNPPTPTLQHSLQHPA